MKVIVNGEATELDSSTTLDRLLASRGHDPRYIAVAVNETIVAKGRYSTHELREGDEVEIVAPQAGG